MYIYTMTDTGNTGSTRATGTTDIYDPNAGGLIIDYNNNGVNKDANNNL